MENKLTDVMVDLETFGKTKDSVIVQIGACYFDRVTGEIGEKLFINIDAESSLEKGFVIDASTVYWWLGQSDSARKSITEGNKLVVTEAIQKTNQFLANASNIWSHATFDYVILMNHLEKLNIKPSFRYTTARDIRTLVDLAGINIWTAYKRTGVAHTALEDCLFQVKYCVDCMNKLRGNK